MCYFYLAACFFVSSNCAVDDASESAVSDAQACCSSGGVSYSDNTTCYDCNNGGTVSSTNLAEIVDWN